MDTKRISFTSAESFPLKVCIHRELLGGIREGYIKPIHLQFMPTNKCNLNCSFCSCSKRDKDLEFPIKEVAELSSLMAELGCRAVSVTGGGEPLMHPYINEMIYMLFVNDMDIGLVTNGLLLDKLYSGDAITWCRISCSDDRKLTMKYECILDLAVSRSPNIDWSFSYVVSTPERFDLDNLIQMVSFANEHKFTHVRVVSDLIDIKNTVSMSAIKDRLTEQVDDSLVIYQGRNTWDYGTKDCLISLLKPTVGADGYVYPCCIDENESVLIEEGGVVYPKYIKDIDVGDFAYGNGVIVSKFSKEDISGLLITLKNGRQVVTSHDHVWLTLKEATYTSKTDEKYGNIDSFALDQVEARNLKIGDLVPAVYSTQPSSSIDINDDKIIVSGYYLAEGWSDEKKMSVGFAFGHHEKDKVDFVVSLLPGCKVYKRRTTYQVMCYNREWLDWFKLFGSRATEKQIPKEVFSLSNSKKQLFIKSYLEGDGCVQKPSKAFDGFKLKFSTVSKKLASDLVYLFSTISVVAVLKRHKRSRMLIEGRTVNCNDIYRINVSGNYNLERLYFIKEDLLSKKKSPRRALGKLKTDSICFSEVVSIEPTSSRIMYDIQVEGTNSFYTSCGILIHNCGVQYARDECDLDTPADMRMGHWRDMRTLIKYNGSACIRCYYKNYNDLLGLLTSDIQHKNFL